MERLTESILWRRLDAPGHDACRLIQLAGGWSLDGAAVFRQDADVARLAYHVTCDREWRSRRGTITGWIGAEAIDIVVERGANGEWAVNGAAVPDVRDCLDLDFGFTPATNLFQIRRSALRIGESADVPVAWMDIPGGILSRLEQRYERRSESSYWYESPSFHYSATLEISAACFARRYPDLWEAE
jgi:hypothetical protein